MSDSLTDLCFKVCCILCFLYLKVLLFVILLVFLDLLVFLLVFLDLLVFLLVFLNLLVFLDLLPVYKKVTKKSLSSKGISGLLAASSYSA